MKRLIMMLLTVVVSLSALAQSADKLYEEGKKLYDDKNYTAAFPKLKAAAEKAATRRGTALPRTRSWPSSGMRSRPSRAMPRLSSS